MWARTRMLAFIAAICITSLYILSNFGFHYQHVTLMTQYRQKSIDLIKKKNSACNITGRSKVVILVYTPMFGREQWINKGGKCAEQQCRLDLFEITLNKTRLSEVDLVIFHARDMPSVTELKSLLKSKPCSQRWVYASVESPLLTPDASPLNGVFNLTWTYRTDSDFWAPYGSYEPLSQEELKQNEIANVSDYTQGKSELVVLMISGCVFQLRLSFIRELKSFIKVDIPASGCNNEIGGEKNMCSPGKNSADCIRKYKFYLAFENALCEDYITETYWNVLGGENVVPVVMGGADYTKLAIPGSYINVLNFKTVKQLAEYLQYLDKNNTAYNEYFKWKLKYKVSPGYSFSLCSICERFNDLPETKVYDDFQGFWAKQGRCNEKYQLIKDMLYN